MAAEVKYAMQPYALQMRDLKYRLMAAQATIDESLDPDVQFAAWMDKQCLESQMRACICYARSVPHKPVELRSHPSVAKPLFNRPLWTERWSQLRRRFETLRPRRRNA